MTGYRDEDRCDILGDCLARAFNDVGAARPDRLLKPVTARDAAGERFKRFDGRRVSLLHRRRSDRRR